MDPKGQVSAEFVIIAVLLFSLFLFSLFVFKERHSGLILSKEQIEAKLIADKLARAINTVFLAGKGAKTTFFLEKNFEYQVGFFENAVQVSWKANFSDAALLTNQITAGTITPGGFVTIENTFGGIKIESS